mgnify:CR=1 FL=1
MRLWSLMILVGVALCWAATAMAQDDPDLPAIPNLAPIDAETVHSIWVNFEPEFTPYVCPFHTAAPDYDPEEFRCGYVLVPEDRTDPNRRLLQLSVLKIASPSENAENRAVIRLTGGPGGPSLSAGRISAYQRADTQGFREAADLIFFDQRGIGYSEPGFCRAVPREFQFGVSTAEGLPLKIEAFRKCLAEARAKGIAVDAYSTWQNALDVRDIRRALGYEQWTLFGVSYGTELGQAVMEVDEAGTRAAILDSVVPANPLETGGWNAVAYGFRSALTAITAACAEDPNCARDIGAMDERFIEVFAAYDADPLILEDVDHGSFLDGRLVMDGDLAAGAVFQALYINTLYADFPSLLRALETRNEDAIHAYIEVLGRPIDHAAGNGMELVANCRGAAPLSEAQRAAMQEAEPLLSQWVATVSWSEACLGAYKIDPDPVVKTLETDIPILVAAGTIDPITPPSFGQAILPSLPNAQYVEFPATGHGALLSQHPGCGGELWLQFVKDPNAPLETSCVDTITPVTFVTRLIETPAPYHFARGLQAGRYPYLALIAAVVLIVTLLASPLGWAARAIQGSETVETGYARPLAWLGAAFTLGGLGFAVSQILKTATSHPMALPLGVLPSAGGSFWLALLGFGLCAAAVYRAIQSGGFGTRAIGTSVGLDMTCAAAL